MEIETLILGCNEIRIAEHPEMRAFNGWQRNPARDLLHGGC
jgi:hypothetical protein